MITFTLFCVFGFLFLAYKGFVSGETTPEGRWKWRVKYAKFVLGMCGVYCVLGLLYWACVVYFKLP